MKTLLQIVPQLPGTHDGVGDYALNLAQALKQRSDVETIFAVAGTTSKEAGGFAVRSFEHPAIGAAELARDCEHTLLHYVNYGYHARGVPRWLPQFMRALRSQAGTQLTVIFHELYADVSSPWRSAFWLRPLQIRIAREIASLAHRCFVSSETMGTQLRQIAQPARLEIHPVMSNFGEPALVADDFVRRDRHRWVIAGGTALVARSVRSFLERRAAIPEAFAPRELFVLGGKNNDDLRNQLKNSHGLEWKYSPEIEVSEASAILSSCSFGWLDYFQENDAPTGAILKSTSFAAYCAHGVAPIFPRAAAAIAIGEDRLPGPFFLERNGATFPQDSARASAEIYHWYHRHASSGRLADAIGNALGAEVR